MLDALKWTLETEKVPTLPKKGSLTIKDLPTISSLTESVEAPDFTVIPSIQARQAIPTLDVITPVTERQSFLESNQNLHVLIVDDNDINLKVRIS